MIPTGWDDIDGRQFLYSAMESQNFKTKKCWNRAKKSARHVLGSLQIYIKTHGKRGSVLQATCVLLKQELFLTMLYINDIRLCIIPQRVYRRSPVGSSWAYMSVCLYVCPYACLSCFPLRFLAIIDLAHKFYINRSYNFRNDFSVEQKKLIWY